MTNGKKTNTLIALVAVAIICSLFILFFAFPGGSVSQPPRTSVGVGPKQPDSVSTASPPTGGEAAQAEQGSAAEATNAESISNLPDAGALPLPADQESAPSQSKPNLPASAQELGVELVSIPSGTFLMGSSEDEKDRRPNEGPQTQVTITYSFWMSKYEITLGQYRGVVGKNPHFARRARDLGLPVLQVSWFEATNFCYFLTQGESTARRVPQGYEYRLPTEAEWEYACRAGTTTRFTYGNDPDYSTLYQYAWFGEASPLTPHPLGLKQPNPWGLCDMYGNAWEWCLDWLGTNYSEMTSTDPVGRQPSEFRAIRGGSWLDRGAGCRTACRSGVIATGPAANIGFRVVLAPALSGEMRVLVRPDGGGVGPLTH